jgi:predicted nucleic acid-binding protein
MRAVYVDSSVILSIAFDEPPGTGVRARLADFDRVFATPLLEAEVLAAGRREQVNTASALLSDLSWVLDTGRLTDEIGLVLRAGYVRGADCWHLATALFLDPEATSLTFLTLDDRQRAVAEALGFRT